MTTSKTLTYPQALELNFKTDTSFTPQVYSSLLALYSILGDSELYDGMMSATEDAHIDEWHVSTLALMEDIV